MLFFRNISDLESYFFWAGLEIAIYAFVVVFSTIQPNSSLSLFYLPLVLPYYFSTSFAPFVL